MDLQPLPLPVTADAWLPWTDEQARVGLAAAGGAGAAPRASVPGDPVALERWNDLFAPEVARRYRDTVLVAVGSGDAADLVGDSLCPFDDRAFTARLDSSPEEHL